MNWFFDLGSHLFESVGIFADIVGNSHDWNVVCVEAAYTDDNKRTIDQILATRDITAHFKSFSFLPIAVSTYSGLANFKRDFSYPNSGSSTLIDEKPLAHSQYISIPCIDIVSLLLFAHKDDNIILKVDIEGFEYAIFDRLFETGLLSRVSAVYIELHEYKLSRNIDRDYRLLSQLQQYHIPLYEWESQSIPTGSTLSSLPKIDIDYIQNLYSYELVPLRSPFSYTSPCIF